MKAVHGMLLAIAALALISFGQGVHWFYQTRELTRVQAELTTTKRQDQLKIWELELAKKALDERATALTTPAQVEVRRLWRERQGVCRAVDWQRVPLPFDVGHCFFGMTIEELVAELSKDADYQFAPEKAFSHVRNSIRGLCSLIVEKERRPAACGQLSS